MRGNELFERCGATVFEEMSRLAAAQGAVNLGQGFPLGLEPPEVLAAAAAALAAGPHQYPSMLGTPTLRKAVAAADLRFWGLAVDWESEVLVTSGATEALACCFFGLLNPGDEAIILEPAYDSYEPIIRRAGATPARIRLTPPEWRLTRAALDAVATPRTKLIVINSPMNPTGALLSAEELDLLADFIAERDLIAVCDEVYEHLTYDGRAHVSLATRPQAQPRCLRIGSAGKSFSVTGWKVGYIRGPAELLRPVVRAHQYLTFTTPPFLQEAVAQCLAMPDSYFKGLRRDLQARRDLLAQGLERLGIRTTPSAGTYFLCAQACDLDPAAEDDWALCRRLTCDARVAAIPLSSFYADRSMRSLVRFCFAKPEAELTEALARLGAWLGR